MYKFQERQQAIGNGSHAVVIGSGIAGLLAARVLLNHFQYVTVIERDSLPEQPQPRPGVPQSVQSHGLLVRGQRILEQLFPGLSAELSAAGAISVDWCADTLYLSSMGTAPRCPSDLITSMCSRNLLEWSIRRRLTGGDRLQFLEATQVMLLSMDCPEVHRTMNEIYHMVKPPIAFFQPNIAAKVLMQAWKRKTKPPLLLQDCESSITARG